MCSEKYKDKAKELVDVIFEDKNLISFLYRWTIGNYEISVTANKVKNINDKKCSTAFEEKIRCEVTGACASVRKDTINDLSAKGAMERAIKPAVRNIGKKHC